MGAADKVNGSDRQADGLSAVLDATRGSATGVSDTARTGEAPADLAERPRDPKKAREDGVAAAMNKIESTSELDEFRKGSGTVEWDDAEMAYLLVLSDHLSGGRLGEPGSDEAQDTAVARAIDQLGLTREEAEAGLYEADLRNKIAGAEQAVWEAALDIAEAEETTPEQVFSEMQGTAGELIAAEKAEAAGATQPAGEQTDPQPDAGLGGDGAEAGTQQTDVPVSGEQPERPGIALEVAGAAAEVAPAALNGEGAVEASSRQAADGRGTGTVAAHDARAEANLPAPKGDGAVVADNAGEEPAVADDADGRDGPAVVMPAAGTEEKPPTTAAEAASGFLSPETPPVTSSGTGEETAALAPGSSDAAVSPAAGPAQTESTAVLAGSSSETTTRSGEPEQKEENRGDPPDREAPASVLFTGTDAAPASPMEAVASEPEPLAPPEPPSLGLPGDLPDVIAAVASRADGPAAPVVSAAGTGTSFADTPEPAADAVSRQGSAGVGEQPASPADSAAQAAARTEPVADGARFTDPPIGPPPGTADLTPPAGPSAADLAGPPDVTPVAQGVQAPAGTVAGAAGAEGLGTEGIPGPGVAGVGEAVGPPTPTVAGGAGWTYGDPGFAGGVPVAGVGEGTPNVAGIGPAGAAPGEPANVSTGSAGSGDPATGSTGSGTQGGSSQPSAQGSGSTGTVSGQGTAGEPGTTVGQGAGSAQGSGTDPASGSQGQTPAGPTGDPTSPGGPPTSSTSTEPGASTGGQGRTQAQGPALAGSPSVSGPAAGALGATPSGPAGAGTDPAASQSGLPSDPAPTDPADGDPSDS